NLDALQGAHALDSFAYTVSDSFGGATPATLNVTLDRTPVTVTETATVLAKGMVTGTAGTTGNGALAGDSDADNDVLTISSITGGSVGQVVHGTYGDLTLNSDGAYTYAAGAQPDQVTNLNGVPGLQAVDSFTYAVSDGAGGLTPAALDVTVARVPNHAP